MLMTSSSAGTRLLASLPSEQRSRLTKEDLTLEELRSTAPEIAATLTNADDAYVFSKTAANAYAVLLARERPDLFVNAVSPGFTNTDMCKGYEGKRRPKEVELGASVFGEAMWGVGKGRTGVFLKQASEAGTKLEDAKTVITDWST